MPPSLILLLLTTAALELRPVPQQMAIEEKGLFPLDTNLTVVIGDTQADMPDILAPISDALGFVPHIVPASRFKSGERALYVGVLENHDHFTRYPLKRYITDIGRYGEQAYTLRVWKKGILIAGAGRAGMIHGIHTLASLIKESRNSQIQHRGSPALPFTEILDYPDLSLRGAYVQGPLTKKQILLFAACKCNMLIFESEDFYDINEGNKVLWQTLFQQARNAGITPVPVLQFLHVPLFLLAKAPTAVEGRSRIDRLQLSDTAWSPLARSNIIVTAENPLYVTVPFREEDDSYWKLRRNTAGALSNNDVVEVTYSYAPPSSQALCPHAPEAELLYREAAEKLIVNLDPAFIHCGFSDIGRLNQDLRCRAKSITNAEALSSVINLVHQVFLEINPELRLIFWADTFFPPQSDTGDKTTSLHPARENIPESSMLMFRFNDTTISHGVAMDKALRWMTETGWTPVAAVRNNPPLGYEAVVKLNGHQEQLPGVVLLNVTPDDPHTQSLFEKAWSSVSVVLPWPECYNAFFGTNLWNPDFLEAKQGILQFVEQQILAGVSPREIQNNFEKRCSSRLTPSTPGQDETPSIARFLNLVIRYLELEFEYASGKTRSALRDLASLVEDYGELDVTVEPERIALILDTITQQSLFVPASILFGRPLAYYRPFNLPADTVPVEAPARPHYEDAEESVQATLDFLVPCGPVYRLDFETINARSFTVQASDDGNTFNQVPIKPALAGDALSGPLFLSSGITSRFLRIKAVASDSKPVLRDVRAFVLRQPARLQCPSVGNAALRAGSFVSETGQLATAPTEILLSKTLQGITLTLTARDPMPHAIGASMTGTDKPLWDEESVEIRIRPPNNSARRFLVNPLGAKHDSMAVAANVTQWDSGWDGTWNVKSSTDDSGWYATIELPFSILGGVPEPGEAWDINFLRHRNNVKKETSTWAASPEPDKNTYGQLLFE